MGCRKMDKAKVISALVFIMMIVGLSFNAINTFIPIIIQSFGDDSPHSWDNTTTLNVTIEHPEPRILWYDIQQCTSYTGSAAPPAGETWVSVRNQEVDVDNQTWYRFCINVSSDQGWDNIEYINISGWHDNGTDADASGYLNNSDGGYNRSGNRGANRNFYIIYSNLTGLNDNANYSLIYPSNNSEMTLGRFNETVGVDILGTPYTENMNLTFEFKPGYQFRYSPGPATWTQSDVNVINGTQQGAGFNDHTSCWQYLNNTWSWNFNMSVTNRGENWSNIRYKSWVLDEFGIYAYTEIVSAGWPVIYGRPGGKFSTNSTSWFNSNSQNISLRTRSNGNYSLCVNLSDLKHSADSSIILDNKSVYIRGGTRTASQNFTDFGRSAIWLYGDGSSDGASVTTWELSEMNGTCKYTGEAGDDSRSALYPTGYSSSNYNGLNAQSHYVEYSVYIPLGQQAGVYRSTIYYHLRTQTN
jgi:hypothetical protein